MTATRTTRPPEPLDTGKTDKTDASHGCQWKFRRNAERQATTIFWVLVSKISYFHPDPWGNGPIWLIFSKWVETTNEYSQSFLYYPLSCASSFISTIPPSSISIHIWTTSVRNYSSSSIIIRHHLSRLIAIHHHPLSIYFHLSSSMIIHHRPPSSIINHFHPSFFYHDLSTFTIIHHHQSLIIIHHRPTTSIMIHYEPPSSIIINHHPLWTTIIHHPSSSTIIHSSFITNIHQSGLVLVPAVFMPHACQLHFKWENMKRNCDPSNIVEPRNSGSRWKSLVDPDVFAPGKMAASLVFFCFISSTSNLGGTDASRWGFLKWGLMWKHQITFETCECLCGKNNGSAQSWHYPSSGLNPLRQVSGIGGSWWILVARWNSLAIGTHQYHQMGYPLLKMGYPKKTLHLPLPSICRDENVSFREGICR